MTREQVVDLAKSLNWREWGKLRKKHGSSYQCFRKGNTYCWIGLRFIEHQDAPIAVDFSTSPVEVEKVLNY